MDLLFDWNHVINIKLTDEEEPLQLIPTANMKDMILMHANCNKCWSMHGATWTPSQEAPSNAAKQSMDLSYFYMMHLYDANVQGRNYKMNACFDVEDSAACGTDLDIFAIENADPWFYTLGEGYFGMQPGKGSLLDQMYDKGMIAQKLVGVHTHMFNSTEDPSVMRFGGVNTELFNSGYEMIWMNTTSPDAWTIKFNSAGFIEKDTWKYSVAVIDPGYPFIGLPKDAFEAFKKQVIEEYPDEAVTCDDNEWCYFLNSCDDIASKIPDLKFTFPVTHELEAVTFSIPPKSFLYNDVDSRTGIKMCHLGIVQQQYSGVKHFVLGQAFMENFYVVYDAHTSTQPHIGLSFNIEGEQARRSAILMLIIGLVVVIALAVVGVFAACWYARKRRQQKLEKAKAYFNSLKTADDDGDTLDAEDAAEADREAKSTNPNSFVGAETSNELAVGNLL